MSNTDFLGRAIAKVKEAIEKDEAGDYETAWKIYLQACKRGKGEHFFDPCIPHVKGEMAADTYLSSPSGYLYGRGEM